MRGVTLNLNCQINVKGEIKKNFHLFSNLTVPPINQKTNFHNIHNSL
ncbi:hypothetical protein M153_5947000138, partial [Pseudoloma neurophilia]